MKYRVYYDGSEIHIRNEEVDEERVKDLPKLLKEIAASNEKELENYQNKNRDSYNKWILTTLSNN